MFLRIKGTQDFLDLTLFNFVIDQFKRHAQTYHFQEIATPVIEPVALFKRSLGTETDVVSKEMFIIAPRTPQDEEICLRPEATASIARAFVENGIDQVPWKVFTWGPMFRYERPQKGRYRQFHQISIEVIGSASPLQDVEFIKMMDRFFHERLAINNYALQLNYLGCTADRVAYETKLKKFLDASTGICQLCTARKEKNILRVFDCKTPECQEIYKKAPHTADALCLQCAHDWQEIQNQLQTLSVSFVYQPTLVRGLDYYNKTVFEFVSHHLGAQNAFCGGGRYDQLIQQIGSKEDQPSIGAAIGIERLIMVMELVKSSLALPQLPSLQVIIPLTQEQQTLALLLADELQARDLCTQVFLEGGSMKSMMRKANKLGAQHCLILGEDEQKTHTVTIKNMVTGHEERIPQINVVEYIKK